MPDHLIQPPVAPGYEDWWNDFWELCTDRQIGNVIGPLPATSIDRHTAEWPAAQRSMFKTCMRAMDGVYLAHVQSGGLPDGPDSDNIARDGFRAAMKQGPDK